MYRFVPQKRRSALRLKFGTAYFCARRQLAWLRWRNCFVRRPKADCIEEIRRMFPYRITRHASPIFRNLSEEDTALQAGKAANLALAAQCVSGAVLAPGHVFSYWRLIGNPTRRKGYQDGMMLLNGRPVAAVGGGLCALSNLIYWMTLHTPLFVAERFRHSYDVFPDVNRTRPFGSGATCVYNYRDLMIQNRTAVPYALVVWLEDGMLHGEWRSPYPAADVYEVYQKEHWITSEAPGVYVRHNTIWRRHFVPGSDGSRILHSDEYVTENHALMMYEPLLESTCRKDET